MNRWVLINLCFGTWIAFNCTMTAVFTKQDVDNLYIIPVLNFIVAFLSWTNKKESKT